MSTLSPTHARVQSYLFFFDKLNKANYYLELMIENADLPIDDRLIQHLSSDLISDGGQWDMVVNLLEVRHSVYNSQLTANRACTRPTASSRRPSTPNPSTPPCPAL